MDYDLFRHVYLLRKKNIIIDGFYFLIEKSIDQNCVFIKEIFKMENEAWKEKL